MTNVTVSNPSNQVSVNDYSSSSASVNSPAHQVIITDPTASSIRVVSVGIKGPAGSPSYGNLIVGGGVLQNEITVKSTDSRDLFVSANTLTAGNVVVNSNIVPQQNAVFSLGSPDALWKDIHVSNSTIFIGTNSSISSDAINLGNFLVDPSGSIRIPGVDIVADANAITTVEIIASDIASNALIQATTGLLVDLQTIEKSNLVAAINEVFGYTETNDGLVLFQANIGDLVFTSANIKSNVGDLTLTGKDVRIQGNLVVEGTTTSVESIVTVLEDPTITLGGNNALLVDDSKDRGVEFRYYDGGSKLGFFGWDQSNLEYVFLSAATNSGEVFEGTLANVKAETVYANVIAQNITVTDSLTAIVLSVETLSANAVTSNVSGNVQSELVTAGNLTLSNNTLESSSNLVLSANGSINLISNVTANIVQIASLLLGEGLSALDCTVASNVSIGEKVVSSFNKNNYKFAKLIINTEDLTYGQTQISEVLLTHDGFEVKLTEYAIVHTSTNPLVTFNAFIESDNVVLKASTQSSDNLIKVTRILN